MGTKITVNFFPLKKKQNNLLIELDWIEWMMIENCSSQPSSPSSFQCPWHWCVRKHSLCFKRCVVNEWTMMMEQQVVMKMKEKEQRFDQMREMIKRMIISRKKSTQSILLKLSRYQVYSSLHLIWNKNHKVIYIKVHSRIEPALQFLMIVSKRLKPNLANGIHYSIKWNF